MITFVKSGIIWELVSCSHSRSTQRSFQSNEHLLAGQNHRQQMRVVLVGSTLPIQWAQWIKEFKKFVNPLCKNEGVLKIYCGYSYFVSSHAYKCDNRLFLKIAFGGTKLAIATKIMTMLIIIIAFRKGSASDPFQFLDELLGFHKRMYELCICD